MDLNNKKCKSVREFFDYLIASGQLLESQKSYDEKTRTKLINGRVTACLLYTSPSPRDS